MGDLFDRHRVIDVDSHISEPSDLWTSRVSGKWGDAVPHTRIDPASGKEIWWLGGEPTLPVGMTAIAGFDGALPDCPDTMADIPRGRARPPRATGLPRPGRHPRAGALSRTSAASAPVPSSSLAIGELMLECVRAYNDFLDRVVVGRPDASRLVPIMAAIAVLGRAGVGAARSSAAAALGAKRRAHVWQPGRRTSASSALANSHWDPVWSARPGRRAADQLPHRLRRLGRLRGSRPADRHPRPAGADSAPTPSSTTRSVSPTSSSAASATASRSLDFVSVESGVGWAALRPRSLRLAVAQRRHPPRPPRVRSPAQRVLPASDLRMLLVRGDGPRQGTSSSTPTTCSSRPTTRTPTSMSVGPASIGRAPARIRPARADGPARERRRKRSSTTTPQSSTASTRHQESGRGQVILEPNSAQCEPPRFVRDATPEPDRLRNSVPGRDAEPFGARIPDPGRGARLRRNEYRLTREPSRASPSTPSRLRTLRIAERRHEPVRVGPSARHGRVRPPSPR